MLKQIAIGCIVIASSSVVCASHAEADQKISVVISGGHELDPRDHGRPIALISAALGVTARVFREAFSHVKPAPSGERPDPDQVARNKEALLDALGKYGVTNDRLDEVSDHYRYNQSRGEVWSRRPAKVVATVSHGVVTKLVIQDAGAGYTSAPSFKIPNISAKGFSVKLNFGTDLATNGSISQLKIK